MRICSGIAVVISQACEYSSSFTSIFIKSVIVLIAVPFRNYCGLLEEFKVKLNGAKQDPRQRVHSRLSAPGNRKHQHFH